MTNPRLLRILAIDDSEAGSQHDSPQTETEVPCPYERLQIGGIPRRLAICNWADALQYHATASACPPDIVTADVVFDRDRTSPLFWFLGKPDVVQKYSMDGYDGPLLPTGLLHALPYSAIARHSNRPMVLRLHTAHPQLWEAAWSQDNPLAGLAAHILGELASVQGNNLLEGFEIEEEVEPDEEYFETAAEACWKWLRAHNSGDFPAALNAAVSEYRRVLVQRANPQPHPQRNRAADISPAHATSTPVSRRLHLLPSEYTRLLRWLKMHEAKALSSGASALEPEAGIRLRFPDGREDYVSVQSLYSDVNDIISKPLPAYCYTASPRPGEEVWSVPNGLPLIGAFVRALEPSPSPQ